MTREQKISAIYKEMANKELTLGCKVKFSKWIYSIIDRENVWFLSSYKGQDWDIYNTIVIEDGVNSRCYSIEEIIWHPVMIGDVLRQIRLLAGYALDNDLIKKSDFWNVIAQHNYRITQIWEDFREPIESQSDECIDYVYSLIPSISME